ncbi:cellobiohydrolaseII [Coprinopsis sp. MPI-PUGE-AT-0042]|nr:cellobiohydrolaseII [Coprinopsis sp. MPI-PUGE-AT-0042]
MQLKQLTALLTIVPFFALSAAQANNPYETRKPLVNKSYAKKLDETVAYFTSRGDALNAARTRTVQKIPTFAWISDSASIADIKPLITDAVAQQAQTGEKVIVQLVIYNLPDRDCSAKASDGEFHLIDDGLNKYKNYIDKITQELSTADANKVHFAIILEPDSLPNIVTNLSVPNVQVQLKLIVLTISKLAKANIDLYIDAAHGGWLGWEGSPADTAKVYKEVIDRAKALNPNSKIRGFATNVSNYNPFNITTPEPYTEGNDNYSEFRYVNALGRAFSSFGITPYFIVDQGRSGRTGVRTDWSQWCNIRNAGFGMRPTADRNVKGSNMIDAIVWVKPGGESDGTSDRSAVRFDENCQSPVAHTPAPEAGAWFNEFVVNLVKNANPPFESTES